jgi:hypothetical protein
MFDNSNNGNQGNKNYSYRTSDTYYLPQRIGPGALANHRIATCEVCKDNGYAHEAVVARAGKLLNYHTGTEHLHKQILDDPKIWAELWSNLK